MAKAKETFKWVAETYMNSCCAWHRSYPTSVWGVHTTSLGNFTNVAVSDGEVKLLADPATGQHGCSRSRRRGIGTGSAESSAL
jgi:hypothetical protein